MTVPVHQITSGQVRALADGSGARADLEILTRAQRSKTLAMIELVARRAALVRHPDAASAAAGRDLLARVQREAPPAAEDLLRYPVTGAWAVDTLLGLGSADPGQARPGRLALIAAAAAMHGGVRAELEIPSSECAGPELLLPSLGSVELRGGMRGGPVSFRTRNGAAEIRRGEDRLGLPASLEASAGWRPLATVTADPGTGEFRVVLDDTDLPWLPGYPRTMGPLAPADLEQWRRRIEGGWRLLALHHRRAADDIQMVLVAISPLDAADGGRRSATSRHAFGMAGLSLPGDDVDMALTLIHEAQHAKLCALMDLLPLVNEPPGPGRRLYYAPWRPDPRPLSSLLQGLYAYVGVTRFWLRQRNVPGDPADIRRASVEFDRWRTACARIVSIVRDRPELTQCGALFVEGMTSAIQDWRHERVPPGVRAEARRIACEHRKRWGQTSGKEAASGYPAQ